MFSCANLYYKYAQSNSYRVLNFKSVKKTDMKSTTFWISYHFWTYKHWDKFGQKVIWLFSDSYRSILISGFIKRLPKCFETNVTISWFGTLFQWKIFPFKNQLILITFWLSHSFWRIWRIQMKPILLWSKLKLLKHKFCFVKTNWKP